jgi:hypothetical protein
MKLFLLAVCSLALAAVGEMALAQAGGVRKAVYYQGLGLEGRAGSDVPWSRRGTTMPRHSLSDPRPLIPTARGICVVLGRQWDE